MLGLYQAQQGITLIELAIGLTIIFIVLLVGMPNASSIQNAQVRTAAESVLNGLQAARVEAVIRNAQARFQLADAEGISKVHIVSGQPAVAFNSLGRQSSIAGLTPSPPVTVNIDVRKSSVAGTCRHEGGTIRCLRIIVSVMGQIRLCDPALTLANPTDPQAC